MFCIVTLVGKHFGVNRVEILEAGFGDGLKKSMTLKKSRICNKSQITVANIRYLSLIKRSYIIKYLFNRNMKLNLCHLRLYAEGSFKYALHTKYA